MDPSSISGLELPVRHSLLRGNSQPFASLTWNILLDIDGDGYKEFVMMLEGIGRAAQPDDIVVIYDNAPSQEFSTALSGVWRQDCAGANDGANGASGTSSTWDLDSDEYVWDFGRTRVVQIDRSRSPNSQLSEYFIDIQVPLDALDASSLGGPHVTLSSFFSILVTSSNSNVDPTQKDVIYSGDIALANAPLPGGDLTNGTGQILQDPLITTVEATPCPAPVTLGATILDALTVDPVTGETKDTQSSVTFEYFYDYNQNGLPDDAGHSWTSIGPASRTATVGLWQLSWDVGPLSIGKYLIRAITVDNQGNTTVSTDQPYLSPSSVTAQFNHICSDVAVLDLSTKSVSDLNGGEAVPGDTLSYTIAVRNTGGLDATTVVVRDTLESGLAYVPESAAPTPAAVSPGLLWNVGTLAPNATATYTFRAVVTAPIADGTQIANTGWIAYNSGALTDRLKSVTALITVSSRPRITLTKTVSVGSAVPGDTLTYTLSYVNYGTDGATEVVIVDFVPEFTDYVTSSITVDGAGKTDAADGDGVTVTGTSMIVTVGTVLAGGSGQVQFRVRVK